jgi:multidrug resistance protein, MATE family
MPLSHTFFGSSAAGLAAANLSIGLLLLLGAMEFVVNPGHGAAGILRGRKDTRAPMIYTLAGYWLIGAPVGLWLSEGWRLGITGVWAGLAVGTAVTSALMLSRLARAYPRGDHN